MAFLSTIPLPDPSRPRVTQSVTLEGRSYVFSFVWNSRTDRWSLGIATEDGDQIINGALLQVGVDILRTIPATLDYVPPGQLYLAGDNDPSLTTMSGVSLFYVPSQ